MYIFFKLIELAFNISSVNEEDQKYPHKNKTAKGSMITSYICIKIKIRDKKSFNLIYCFNQNIFLQISLISLDGLSPALHMIFDD